jgi:hypothetical protein
LQRQEGTMERLRRVAWVFILIVELGYIAWAREAYGSCAATPATE